MIQERDTEHVRIINTNAWSHVRESRNRQDQDQAGVDVDMPESDEHVVGRRSAQHPSCPGRVVYHPLCEEIADTFSKSPYDSSVTTVRRVQRYRQLRSGEQGGKNASCDCTAPSQEARAGGKEPETHHDGFSQQAVSRNLTLLSDTLRIVTLNKSLSNCVFTNTNETLDGTLAGTSTLTSQNKRQEQGLHDAGSQRRIGRGMLRQEVRHHLRR